MMGAQGRHWAELLLPPCEAPQETWGGSVVIYFSQNRHPKASKSVETFVTQRFTSSLRPGEQPDLPSEEL